MSDNPNGPAGGGGAGPRRSSITQAALSNLFSRGPSANSSSLSGSMSDAQRRRLSVTTVGLSAAPPANPTALGFRRGSMSTNSDSIDENAVDDDDLAPNSAKTAPNTPYVRHTSFGSAMRGYRQGGSPGNGKAPASPSSSATPRGSSSLSAAPPLTALSSFPSPRQASITKHPRASSDNVPSRLDQPGFNWSEQLRSRAESSVSGARPSFSLASSPPRAPSHHDRAKSVSDMPHPPVQASAVKPKPEVQKPDAFQERILKGDFYMD